VAGDQQGERPRTDAIVSGKRVAADWSVGLGEEVASLVVVGSSRKDNRK